MREVVLLFRGWLLLLVCLYSETRDRRCRIFADINTVLLGISVTSKANPVETPALEDTGSNAPVASATATARADAVLQ